MALALVWLSVLMAVGRAMTSNGSSLFSNSCNLTYYCGIGCFDPDKEGCCNGTIFSLTARQLPNPRESRQSCCQASDGTAYVASSCPMLYRPPNGLNATSPPIQVILVPPFLIAISKDVSSANGSGYNTSNITKLPPLMSAPATTAPTMSGNSTTSAPSATASDTPTTTTSAPTTTSPSPFSLAAATRTPTTNSSNAAAISCAMVVWCVGLVLAALSVA